MTAKAVLNLMTWLKEQGFDDDKIVECIDSMEENEDVVDETIVDKEELDIRRELSHIKNSIMELKFEVMKSSARLKIMDEHIIEEVKKVYEIVDKHREENTATMTK